MAYFHSLNYRPALTRAHLFIRVSSFLNLSLSPHGTFMDPDYTQLLMAIVYVNVPKNEFVSKSLQLQL